MDFRHRSGFRGRTVEAFILAVLVSGLSAEISETRPHVGVPEDWTHHRIKFSSAMLRQHPELAAHEPRAAMQLYREAFAQAQAALGRSMPAAPWASPGPLDPHRDWSVALSAAGPGTGRLAFGQYPAKWQTDPTLPPSCTTDFVIFGLNISGVTGGQPSIVGLNNLYAGGANPLCGGNQPNFLFSYNTTTVTNGVIATSPVLSLDGKKVAFIETITVTGPKTTILHVLNIPTTGAQVTAIPSHDPPAGAMTSLTLAATSSVRSSPWIDYGSDTLYVGLDNGHLYKVTGVFNGTPTLAGAPWPILINSGPGGTLSSPLLDSVSGNLFIGAGNGRLFAVNVNAPAAPAVIQVGRTGSTNPAIYDSPMFDATAGTVFAVTSNDSVMTGASVVQVNASNFSVVARVLIGMGSSGGTVVNLYDGDFDNAYFTSPASGHMLVCGTGAADTIPNYYRLGFNAGGMLQPGTATPISTATNARCGPVTDFFNSNIAGGTDFFFWGVTRNCIGLASSGCVLALANGTTLTSAPQGGGASGIVIDNNYVTMTGGSSIYFSTEAAPNNAVKLTQQGLQ